MADRHALRVRDFRAVEEVLADRLAAAAAAAGLLPELSPVLMTPSELEDATWVVSVAAHVIAPG